MFRPDIDTGAMSPSGKSNPSVRVTPQTLFAEWRFEADGTTEKPDFLLNQPRYRQTKILVAGKNFGCGSSRESAVWALMACNITCVIAPSFGPIFWENCFQNGLLPVQLPDDQVGGIAKLLESADKPEITVDLENCRIELPNEAVISFTLAPERRSALLEGLDEMGELMRCTREFEAFEARDRQERPWLYNGRFAAA